MAGHQRSIVVDATKAKDGGETMHGMLRPICAVAFTAVVTAISSQAPAQKLDMTPAEVRYGQFAGVPLPTIIVAQTLKLFEKQNLKLEVTNIPSATEAVQALAAGQIDLGHTSAISAMLGIAKGAKISLVSGIEASFTDKSGHPWEAVYLIARGEDNIKEIKDLKGRRLGVPSFGSLYDYLLRARLLELGINPKTEVNFVPVPYPQAAGALMQKEVDAVIASMDGYALAQTRGKVHVVGAHTTMEGSRVGYTAALGVGNDFLAQKPDVVIRFLRALLEARQWMEEALKTKNPEYREMIQKTFRMTPEKADFYIDTRGGYYGKDRDFINPLDLPRDLIDKYVKDLKAIEILPADAEVSYDKVVKIESLKKAYESMNVSWDDSKH